MYLILIHPRLLFIQQYQAIIKYILVWTYVHSICLHCTKTDFITVLLQVEYAISKCLFCYD